VLQEIPFYLVVFAPWILAAFAAMAFVSFVGKLTAKPKAPPYVPTPEEAEASKARVLAMIAQAEQMRLKNAHHH